MGSSRLLLARFKFVVSNSVRLYSSSAAPVRRRWTYFSDECDDSEGESAVYKQALKVQRPTTIKYQENLRNSVSLIGRIALPLRKCNTRTGKLGVHTFLSVKASTSNDRDLRVLLMFWNEMAEISTHHLKLNDFVYVSGCLRSYVKVDVDGEAKHMYEVEVTEVNFVTEPDRGTASQNSRTLRPEVSKEDIKQMRRNRLHLWQVFFANPYEWRDNRNIKSNPRAPDFKHKDTGEALWLNDSDPPWIKRQLQLQDSRLSMGRLGEKRNAWSHLSPFVYDDA